MPNNTLERSAGTLICAPTGRDAPLIAAHLAGAEIPSIACSDLSSLCDKLTEIPDMAIIAEEALSPEGISQLVERLKEQPVWSDFSFLILANEGKSDGDSVRAYEFLSALGNFNILERPIHPITLISSVKNILRARKRQYDLKAYLEERGRMESALSILNSDLEQRVDQRSREVAKYHQALLQSQKMEAVGRLAGGVAHDFNNLLTGIIGITEELKESYPPNDPRREDLEEVVKAGQRAFNLTRQLLAFGRRQTVLLDTLDLNRTVTEATSLLTRVIGEDIALKLALNAEEAHVRSSVSYLEQVLFNLIINARDAMPDGGTITVSTRNALLGDPRESPLDLQAGAYVVLKVTDTGAGMPAYILSHIFEPYFTTKEKGKGTGLGLATIYGIVKQTGGDIVVQTEVGKGSSFEVYLPQTNAQEEARARPDIQSHALRGDETILVVEDEDIVRHVTTRKLRGAGYTVLAARDGQEALDLLRKQPTVVDLVITDVILPGINGRQLGEMLRADHPNLKVLYVSGYPEDIITEKGVLHTGINFLDKSFLNNELLGKVKGLLQNGLPPTAPPV